MPAATLSNYLWIPKKAVPYLPPEVTREFEYRIKLLNTPEGRVQQQQIASLNEMAGMGDLIPDITDDDELVIKNWASTSRHWKFSRGNLRKVRKLAKRFGLKIRDERVENPWPSELDGLQRLMEPRDYQPAPFEKWEKAAHGIFEADPGFGKTFIMCWRVLNLRQYTIVLAHTDALVEQFIERFRHGSGTKETGYTPVTNCLEVEEETGIQVVGRYKSPDTLYPVTVATWQSFSSPAGRKALQRIKKFFGLCLVDEAHVFAASVPSSVVNRFHAKFRHGVTATPERKDKLEKPLFDILGPKTAKGKMKQLPLTGVLIATGCRYTGGSRFAKKSEWSRMLNHLAKQASRNDLIFKWIRHDVQQGRNVLLLSDRRQWVLDIVERLNKADIPSRGVLGGMGSKKGIKERNKTIGQMMSGEICVIAATQVFKLGIDIPNLDTVYVTLPMSNMPLLKQIAGRIRRFYEDKQEPVLRYFVDEGAGVLYGCAKSTHKHLVAMSANIVLVPVGRPPDKVTFGDGYLTAVKDGNLKRKGGLKAAVSRSPQGVTKLFEDLRAEAAESDRYMKRMGVKK